MSEERCGLCFIYSFEIQKCRQQNSKKKCLICFLCSTMYTSIMLTIEALCRTLNFHISHSIRSQYVSYTNSYLSLFQYHNSFTFHDGRESVCYDEDGTVTECGLECLLDLCICLSVDVCCSFVQDQYLERMMLEL